MSFYHKKLQSPYKWPRTQHIIEGAFLEFAGGLCGSQLAGGAGFDESSAGFHFYHCIRRRGV